MGARSVVICARTNPRLRGVRAVLVWLGVERRGLVQTGVGLCGEGQAQVGADWCGSVLLIFAECGWVGWRKNGV